MTAQILTQSLVFDNKSISEVYGAIKHVHGDIDASQMVPAIVLPFIPKEDACPQRWGRSLRNFEYNLSNPKPKTRQRRRSAGAGPRNSYFVRLALSQLEVAS